MQNDFVSDARHGKRGEFKLPLFCEPPSLWLCSIPIREKYLTGSAAETRLSTFTVAIPSFLAMALGRNSNEPRN
ncbi:Uncharacterised protein [Enterobacter cloacae]|nr:Uncharacterised protein [Enterobacter cloacae]